MKIAYLSEGNNVYDRRFLEKMVARGHKPYLISYSAGDTVRVDGVEVLHYDLAVVPGLQRFQHRPATCRLVAWHLKRVLARIAPDVLHTGYIQQHGYYGALTGFHPTLSMPWGSDVLIRPEKWLVHRQMAEYTLKQADMITCDCQLVKTRIVDLAGCSPEKVVTFPWGIDLSIFKPLHGPSRVRERLGWQDKEILIQTRQFMPVYGIEVFLDALPAIVSERPQVRVILVGSGPLEQDYRTRLERSALTHHVHFAGHVDEAAMAEYLNAADLYVTTALSDGTSASMLEAMACELPVVVSDAPAYFEWVEEGINGLIVSRGNSKELATAISDLLSKPELRRKMAELNLRIARERADWDQNFDKLEMIYRQLVSPGKRHLASPEHVEVAL
ncbi:MAG: glycosyltransferase family 4 protein [Chloroflexi bacterium]|nr:glycosyltransferase family 4 protein [Chloroflexota bacterium]